MVDKNIVVFGVVGAVSVGAYFRLLHHPQSSFIFLIYVVMQHLREFEEMVGNNLMCGNYNVYNKWGAILGLDVISKIASEYLTEILYEHFCTHLQQVYAEIEKAAFDIKIAAEKYGKMGEDFVRRGESICNACIICGEPIGDSNPRQMCGKTYCIMTEEFSECSK